MAEIDTTNDFLVGMQGGGLLIMIPPRGPMDKAKALRLAAWLVALANPSDGEFDAVLAAVTST